MCSKPFPSMGEPSASRCLFCNVGCPVRVIRSGPDRYLPDYVQHEGYAGLCGRGSVLVDLLDHAYRIRDAHRHGEVRETLSVEAAAREMAEALRSAGSAAVIVDGNYGVDTVAAAGRFARDAGARWAAFVPPSDESLVRGLDAAGRHGDSPVESCEFVGPEALEEADALLVIGDVFATHPVAAHWILGARAKQPRIPLFVLADASGVTTEFASASFQPFPGDGVAAAVASLRTGRAEGVGPEALPLARWKEELRAAKRPAIVVAADSGRDSVSRLASEAAALAKEVGAAVCPLTVYGNAWGAVRTASAGGAVTVEQILTDPPQVLLVIGTDLESALAPQAVASALEAVETLVYVGPMPNRTSRCAALVLPAAFPFEDAGRALLGPGREVAFEPLMAPPAGVPTVRDVLEMAGASAEVRADLSEAAAPAAAGPSSAEPRGEGILLTLAHDPVHFADGSLTREAAWPKAVVPGPVLRMARDDAEAAGLADGRRAVVQGPGGCVEVKVATCVNQRPGQARASAAFPAVRNVFGWELDAPDAYEPVRVQVGKA